MLHRIVIYKHNVTLHCYIQTQCYIALFYTNTIVIIISDAVELAIMCKHVAYREGHTEHAYV